MSQMDPSALLSSARSTPSSSIRLVGHFAIVTTIFGILFSVLAVSSSAWVKESSYFCGLIECCTPSPSAGSSHCERVSTLADWTAVTSHANGAAAFLIMGILAAVLSVVTTAWAASRQFVGVVGVVSIALSVLCSSFVFLALFIAVGSPFPVRPHPVRSVMLAGVCFLASTFLSLFTRSTANGSKESDAAHTYEAPVPSANPYAFSPTHGDASTAYSDAHAATAELHAYQAAASASVYQSAQPIPAFPAAVHPAVSYQAAQPVASYQSGSPTAYQPAPAYSAQVVQAAPYDPYASYQQ